MMDNDQVARYQRVTTSHDAFNLLHPWHLQACEQMNLSSNLLVGKAQPHDQITNVDDAS